MTMKISKKMRQFQSNQIGKLDHRKSKMHMNIRADSFERKLERPNK